MVFSLTLHRINHLGPLAHIGLDVMKYKTIFGTSNFVDELKEKIQHE